MSIPAIQNRLVTISVIIGTIILCGCGTPSQAVLPPNPIPATSLQPLIITAGETPSPTPTAQITTQPPTTYSSVPTLSPTSTASSPLPSPISTSTPAPPPATTQQTTTVKVDLLYFHPTSRCVTCQYFEERTRYVMTTYFKKEVESGQLTLTLYDFMKKENTDLVKKLQVVGSQLFIKTTKNGVENTRNIWEIYQWGKNAEVFAEGLKSMIAEALGAG